MNKKLLTLAIGAAMVAAPFVSVQADSANTTIYGKIHYSWDFVDDDTAAGDTTDDNDDVTGVNRASRIGFKGSEALSGGMKAFYLVETQVGSTLGNRLSYVGLSGNFGTVSLGNNYKPYKLATAKLDMFADTLADHNEIISNGYDGANFESPRSGVFYSSPKFNGIQAAIARVSADDNEDAGDEESETTSLSVTYGAGPLYVGFGWEQQSDDTGVGTGDETTGTKIGAGYKMDAFKVGFEWENISNDDSGVEDLDRDRWLINGSYKMGANTFMAAYGDMDKNDAAGATADDGGSVFSLGVKHSMSKRTSAYAIYSATDNDTNGTVDLNNYASRAVNQDVSAFSFGVVHTF